MMNIDGVLFPVQDIRYDFDDWNGRHLVVCEKHCQWAINRMVNFSQTAVTPVNGVSPACTACSQGEAVEEHPIDAHGRAYCGQDFMAGTICTLPPNHDGFHAPICQECGQDWYDGSCTCEDDTCTDCGGDLYDGTCMCEDEPESPA